MKIIIRDDDINYFTPSGVLERIYSRCFKQGIPVAFAAIPAVLSQDGYNLGYNPFVAQEVTGDLNNYYINNNKELCGYLNQKIAEGLIEVCLHGFEHSLLNQRAEFACSDSLTLREKINKGRKILIDTFPGAEIKTFIPPFDRISREGIFEAVALNMNISVDAYLGSMALPFKERLLFFLKNINPYAQTIILDIKGSRIFLHKNPAFRKFIISKTQPDTYDFIKQLVLNNYGLEYIVIINHYWEFFNRDFSQPTKKLNRWDSLVDILCQIKNKVEFVNFNC